MAAKPECGERIIGILFVVDVGENKVIFKCNCIEKVKDCVCKNFKITISFKNDVLKERVVREIS